MCMACFPALSANSALVAWLKYAREDRQLRPPWLPLLSTALRCVLNNMPLTQLMCAAAGVVCQLRIVLMGLQNTTAGPVATDILAILGALTPPACFSARSVQTASSSGYRYSRHVPSRLFDNRCGRFHFLAE
ncbi:hypothetical protein V5799_012653 [Amblyomma americanum]|uniref:Uncharacterized protein n=1 Tax=Amblyomma americanum TaxID=6943 RepID=A0AAQ4EDS1_AMBAM